MSAATPTFPLRTGPTGRYLVDATGTPVFVNGDTAWSMPVSVLPAEAERYLRDRALKGFTSVIVNVLEALFTADPPRTIDGISPFEPAGDFSAPNEAYFERIDELLATAARHGLELYLSPLYLGYIDPAYPAFGYAGRPEGWHAEVVRNGVEGCRAYGRYLGRRWRDVDNLTWVIGGDRNPGDVIEHLRAFVAGILEADGRHLVTAHVHPDSSAVEQYGDDAWLTLNQTYTYQIVHRKLAHDYRRTPVRPFVLFESTYEGEHDATDLQVRRQAWWALTRGAAGSFLGNFPVWLMAPGWDAALDSPGAMAMAHLGRFTRDVPWWTLEPDLEGRFLVAGQGEENGLDRATAALDAAGRLAVVYVPTPRTITVDLDRLRGWVLRARWFDPATGAWADAGTVTRHGLRQFVTPGERDAVLVLEDPAGGEHGAWPPER